MKVRMAAAMRTAIRTPNSRHRRGIWAYMDIRVIRIIMGIKDTYRTIKDTQGTTTPPHDDLVFLVFKHPYRYLHIHHFMRTFHHGFL